MKILFYGEQLTNIFFFFNYFILFLAPRKDLDRNVSVFMAGWLDQWIIEPTNK